MPQLHAILNPVGGKLFMPPVGMIEPNAAIFKLDN
jgi:hypothetical protein